MRTGTSARRRWVVPVLVGLGVLVTSWGAVEVSSMPDTVRIPITHPHPNGLPAHAASFSHLTHRQSACYTCHPGVFPRAPLGFSHAQMNEGRYCGACHDGHAAFAVGERPCESCHVAR